MIFDYYLLTQTILLTVLLDKIYTRPLPDGFIILTVNLNFLIIFITLLIFCCIAFSFNFSIYFLNFHICFLCSSSKYKWRCIRWNLSASSSFIDSKVLDSFPEYSQKHPQNRQTTCLPLFNQNIIKLWEYVCVQIKQKHRLYLTFLLFSVNIGHLPCSWALCSDVYPPDIHMQLSLFKTKHRRILCQYRKSYIRHGKVRDINVHPILTLKRRIWIILFLFNVHTKVVLLLDNIAIEPLKVYGLFWETFLVPF